MPPEKPNKSEMLNERYLESTSRIIDLIVSNSGFIVSEIAPSLPYFSKLDDDERARLIDLNELVAASADQLVAEGNSPLNTPLFCQEFLSRAGLHTTSDAFSRYENGNLVEVYLSNGQSIFSCFNILRSSAYSLEEMQCRPWTELWFREDVISQKLMTIIGALILDEDRKTVFDPVPTHLLHEKRQGTKRSVWVSGKSFSPVWTTDGGTVGFLCINEIKSKITSSGSND